MLDVACGTGLNFPLLAQGVGSTGTIIGTDYSSGMMARAARKVAQHGWSNVRLLQGDARTLTRERLDLPHGRIDRVLCTLGLSVMPDWESVFQRIFEMLEPGGRYAPVYRTRAWAAEPSPGLRVQSRRPCGSQSSFLAAVAAAMHGIRGARVPVLGRACAYHLGHETGVAQEDRKQDDASGSWLINREVSLLSGA